MNYLQHNKALAATGNPMMGKNMDGKTGSQITLQQHNGASKRPGYPSSAQ